MNSPIPVHVNSKKKKMVLAARWYISPNNPHGVRRNGGRIALVKRIRLCKGVYKKEDNVIAIYSCMPFLFGFIKGKENCKVNFSLELKVMMISQPFVGRW